MSLNILKKFTILPRFQFPFVLSQTFEIILTLEGITPETGNTIQVGTLNQSAVCSVYLQPLLDTSDGYSTKVMLNTFEYEVGIHLKKVFNITDRQVIH